MTVRIVEERGRLVVDIRTRLPDGTLYRERRNAPGGVSSPTGAERWGEQRQAHLTIHGRPKEVREAPTLREFGPKWIKEYAHANGNKPSTIDTKETILRLHLQPVLGAFRLDEIGEPEVARLKLHLAGKSPKTRACVLSVLSTLLGTAARWGEIAKAPEIAAPKWAQPQMGFYDFAEWEALIDGARRAGPMVLATLLLGGDAGLRRGELLALETTDVGKGAVHVVRSEWEGWVGTPKGGRSRRIPCTARLAEALQEIRSLRKRLLWQANGKPAGVETLKSWMQTACRRAGLPESRNLHKLRHTFCSHLAMRGVPMRAIQEWAGHTDLRTTQRYMHLSPHGMDSMIRLLEGAHGEQPKAEVHS